jgi:FAD synthase
VHILDFDADIYDVTIAVELHVQLRSMVPFTSVEHLKQQITSDIVAVRTQLESLHQGALEGAFTM